MSLRRATLAKAHGTAVGTHRGAVGFALTFSLFLSAAAVACPMCKDGVPADPSPTTAPAEAAALDFNASIYVMLAVVAVVGGTVGRAMVKAVRG
jgi:hypothetical protein